jgi:hypothetical protein
MEAISRIGRAPEHLFAYSTHPSSRELGAFFKKASVSEQNGSALRHGSPDVSRASP